MKLDYGFVCDYCGCEIEYIEKTSIKLEKYYKYSNYDKVKSHGSATVIALDLCDNCAGTLYRLMESGIVTDRKKNMYHILKKIHRERTKINN
jgi:hypothetical protein